MVQYASAHYMVQYASAHFRITTGVGFSKSNWVHRCNIPCFDSVESYVRFYESVRLRTLETLYSYLLSVSRKLRAAKPRLKILPLVTVHVCPIPVVVDLIKDLLALGDLEFMN